MASRANRVIGGLAALLSAIALAAASTQPLLASNDERTISFYHIHTKETLTVTYKRNGAFVPEALEKINWIMRDWRKNQATTMDPNTIDIIWEMHEELGSNEPVNIICGYRSRDTNEMLRRTVGGQASQSQHITGKAIDITFPDVPVRRMRYSAMIRERGGVGYYPTSGVPFVHVDTSRVRHWPRMPRDELSLLFPSGHSKHEPADGRPITPDDVERARRNNRDLAMEVAAFFDLRDKPKSKVLVADAGPTLKSAPAPASRPLNLEQRMSVGAPLPPPDATQPDRMGPITQPKLVASPKLADRPSQFTQQPLSRDKARLDQLVSLAALEMPVPKPNPARKSATRGSESAATAPGAGPAKTVARSASSAKPALQGAASQPVAAAQDGATAAHPLMAASARSSWISAPDFDEDHPEELTYRPFPLLPLMTETASFDDPALAVMVHPDTAKALDLIDDEGSLLPMKLGPGRQTASLMWAQEFSGEAVNVAVLEAPEPAVAAVPKPQLASRSVKTLPR